MKPKQRRLLILMFMNFTLGACAVVWITFPNLVWDIQTSLPDFPAFFVIYILSGILAAETVVIVYLNYLVYVYGLKSGLKVLSK